MPLWIEMARFLGFKGDTSPCGLMHAVSTTSRVCVVVLLAAGLYNTASAVAPPKAQAIGRTLLANVVDATGKTQVDFGVDDFLIRDGGDEREVLDVHVADYPMVVLIDGGANDLQAIKTAI